MQRYSLLWVKFKDKEFNHGQATKTLPDDERMVSVILSEMRKAGWLEMRLDPNDARKRLYKLKTPESVIKEIAKSGEK
jgi:type I restriction enzyme M protein